MTIRAIAKQLGASHLRRFVERWCLPSRSIVDRRGAGWRELRARRELQRWLLAPPLLQHSCLANYRERYCSTFAIFMEKPSQPSASKRATLSPEP